MYITKDTTIAKIVYQYPELIEPLHQMGLFCFSWGGAAAWGTLALQASLLGIKDLEKVVDELNGILEKSKGIHADENEHIYYQRKD